MRSLNAEEEMITGINVTPMVDITLVLLIIVMVTARFISETGLKVELPRSSTTEAGMKTSLRVTCTRDGVLYLAKRKVTEDLLTQDLSRRAKADPETHVVLAADQGLPYGEVMRMLDLIKRAGVVKVGLASEH